MDRTSNIPYVGTRVRGHLLARPLLDRREDDVVAKMGQTSREPLFAARVPRPGRAADDDRRVRRQH